MKRLVEYLQIKNIGLFELLFAIFPILGGYAYSSILDLSIIVPILIILFSYKKKSVQKFDFKMLDYFVYFVVIHEILLSVILLAGGKSIGTLINNLVVDIILFYAIYRSVKVIQFEKLIGSLYLIGIVSAIGLIYHYVLIRSGQTVSPIPLPLLPAPQASSRLFAIGIRPVSFFWEPAAYITFIMMPLFVSLVQKKYVLTFFFAISNFLSTSTNGMVFTVLVIVLYVLTQKLSFKRRLLTTIGSAGLIVFLLTSSLFSAGRDKVSDTDVETQARLVNGPAFVQNMDKTDLIAGIPNAVPYDYIIEGNVQSTALLMDETSFYVPAFWFAVIKFGIVGLILYILIIIKPAFKNHVLIPYCAMILLSTFVQSIFLNSNFYSEVVFILCAMYYYNKVEYEKY